MRVAFCVRDAHSGAMLIVWSPKGGSGVSVTAAAFALSLARRGGCRLVDLAGDQPAVLGLASEPVTGVSEWLAVGSDASPDALDRLATEVAPGLALIGRGGPLASPPGPHHEVAPAERLARALRAGAPTVVDAGGADSDLVVDLAHRADALVAVVRPCYLALRRGVGHPLLPATHGVILVEEPGRSLRPGDVERVLDRPVLHVLRAEARIARAVDAGTLVGRLPDTLARMASRVLSDVELAGRAPRVERASTDEAA